MLPLLLFGSSFFLSYLCSDETNSGFNDAADSGTYGYGAAGLGRPDLRAHGYPEPVAFGAVAAAVYGDIAPRRAPSPRIGPSEITVPFQGLGKYHGKTPEPFLPGESCAALRSASGEHLAAVLRGHPLAESVLLGALSLLGLVGPEHFGGTSCDDTQQRLCRSSWS